MANRDRPWLTGEKCLHCGTTDLPKAHLSLCRVCYRKDYNKRKAASLDDRIPVFGKEDTLRGWCESNPYCKCCGKTTIQHSSFGLCMSCYQLLKKRGQLHLFK